VKALFANLTAADLGSGSRVRRRMAERRRVHALFDAIQVAIHEGDRAAVDDLMEELADAIARQTAHTPHPSA